jgi:site-specific DNA-methyltransferase (adenine-specific)
MLAYLVMMAPRLVELHRVLKQTGSLYLHCDPTAGHYLKVLLDAIFDPRNFRSEVVWKRTNVHSDSKRWSDVSDRLLYYVKDAQSRPIWNPPWTNHSAEYVASKYRYTDADGRRYRLDNMTSPNPRPNMTYEWNGYPPPAFGWRYSRETMARLDAEGRIHYPPRKDQRPQLKRSLDEQRGQLLTDVWTDIDPINSQAKERLGYPTQKPESLLERIIGASSNPGDTVLDPFCGCGTAISVAQRLGRRCIGIDITHLAVNLIKNRLHNQFGVSATFEVIGEPVSLPDAEALAKQDPYQFQWWALGLVGARPTQQKKGADQGVDGRLYFTDDPSSNDTKQVILSVKSGNVSVKDVRELSDVVRREKAQIGVLLTLVAPTKPMRAEAAGAGVYHSPWGKTHPRIQILTIAELLAGQGIDMPAARQVNVTFKKAPKAASGTGHPVPLPLSTPRTPTTDTESPAAPAA